ncbi:hypothetical protein HPO96_19595 [Kribbella sandramycini]|uniref:Uncharacterized protein n=1 Tax=Kribbella sandramycini TaxID=60450 RepID=A0A7Y4P1T5_9ACTN|nr:hypothetical protein [Kribbella sandramycini]MBB6564753.1 hypothetical protein [Kribbella sandramycini]NOL42455.1 hypothetical protein [Kribbella sandramycini]
MSNTTPFTIAGQTIDFPDVANGSAIKNAAKRFETAFTLPPAAAFAMSAAMVDPADVRSQLDPTDPFDHLQAIQTPDGIFLLAQPTRVWTSLVSGDGGNGRSRYAIQTASTKGTRPRPWPIGRHHKPAIIDYHPASLADMTAAVRLSAKEIRSQDLITQISRNPRGIWNPPVVVLARTYVKSDDGSVKEHWFLHTVEGSTRVEACHELTDVDPAAPLEHSDDPLEYLRDTHKRFVERFETTPTSVKALGAARAATMPALIVVAAVEGDMITPITDNYPVIINDYVESVHVQPRPFSEVAQSNVIGERFVLTLVKDGKMSTKDAEAILGRDPDITGKPSVRAANLVHTVCNAGNDSLLRDFLITEEGARLTKIRRAKLVGPLIVRQFNDAADSAERALMRAFTPDRLLSPWSISGDDSEKLRKTCIADVLAGNFNSPALAELMARGGPALCATGLLLGDQGSTVKGISALRGSVEKVVEQLAKTAGGVNVLADAVAWADNERLERPRKFDVEGNQLLDKNNDPIHFSTAWDNGNMGIRALAFTGGTIPSSDKKSTDDEPEVELTPEDRYRLTEQRLLSLLVESHTNLLDMMAAKDADGDKLIAKLGMTTAEVYSTLPDRLSKLYARYGKEDDLLASFDEDELPEAEEVEDDDLDEDLEEDDEDEEADE